MENPYFSSNKTSNKHVFFSPWLVMSVYRVYVKPSECLPVTGDIPWAFDRILACARSLSTKTLGRPEGVWRFFGVRAMPKYTPENVQKFTWKWTPGKGDLRSLAKKYNKFNKQRFLESMLVVVGCRNVGFLYLQRKSQFTNLIIIHVLGDI